MNLTVTPTHTIVSLSERNVRGLLSQFEEAGEAQIMRRVENGQMLTVLVESNEQNYSAEGRDGRAGSSGPGQVYGEQIV
jgi:hypothetical protein